MISIELAMGIVAAQLQMVTRLYHFRARLTHLDVMPLPSRHWPLLPVAVKELMAFGTVPGRNQKAVDDLVCPHCCSTKPTAIKSIAGASGTEK
eukprot:SAG31_NODE_957_length_10768_cov_3.322992_6_plen_93_part_00